MLLAAEDLADLVALAEERVPEMAVPLAVVGVSGIRRSELVTALRADVNTDRWTLTVGSDKGSRVRRQVRRTIEIHQTVVPLLEDQLRKLKRSDKLLFPIFVPIQKRKAIAADPVEARCNRATRMLASLVSETRWKMLKGWHTLRHSAISIYLDQGYTFDQIAKWTGHVDAETQKLYTHWFDQQARERMDRLPFDFRAPSGVTASAVPCDEFHRGNSTT